MSVDRERAVTHAFKCLANSLVDGFDVVELLNGLTTACTRLLDIASAGVLLADRQGMLHVVAASSEATWKLELYELQREQGPCLECFHSGAPVSVADLHGRAERWPRFVEAAGSAGFVSVHAVPMRVRDHVMGSLGLFGTHAGALSDDDLSLAQALAHVASVSIMYSEEAADMTTVAEQLQEALSSRVVLEQAKGLLAQVGDLDMDQAFAVLRTYARDRNERLADVAQTLVARTLPARELLEHSRIRAAEGAHSASG